MDYIYGTLYIFELLLFSYVLLFSVYNLLFSISAFFYKHSASAHTPFVKWRFAVFIPAYKEDAVIVDTVENALQQQYDSKMFDIIVIADSLQPETLQKLRQYPIIVHEVFFENSTKAKAIKSAMDSISTEYDYALILDADNHMEPKYLYKLCSYLTVPHLAIQTHRVAKNSNTDVALLDGISEEVNNRIFRQGHVVLGLSSALIGSGMAFEYQMFLDYMNEVTAVGGFDKELELRLLRDRVRIAYASDVYVYDEKVQNTSNFNRQRTRWLSAQLVYFKKHWLDGIWRLVTELNIDYFDKVLQMIAPPRILLLPAVVMATVVVYLLNVFGLYVTNLSPEQWLVTSAISILAIATAIPGRLYRSFNLNMFLKIPNVFFNMVLALFKTKGANKSFIHTQHGTEV